MNRNYIDRNIGVLPEEPANIDTFRNYDPEIEEVVFLGNHFSVPDICDEARQILPIAEAESAKRHWD